VIVALGTRSAVRITCGTEVVLRQRHRCALRPQLGGHSLAVYPIDYPASDQWATGADGFRDAAAHIVSVAATCPNTKMVLGGYSQGAAVAGRNVGCRARRCRFRGGSQTAGA
jgi:alpha/beta superfamily hydrolase